MKSEIDLPKVIQDHSLEKYLLPRPNLRSLRSSVASQPVLKWREKPFGNSHPKDGVCSKARITSQIPVQAGSSEAFPMSLEGPSTLAVYLHG